MCVALGKLICGLHVWLRRDKLGGVKVLAVDALPAARQRCRWHHRVQQAPGAHCLADQQHCSWLRILRGDFSSFPMSFLLEEDDGDERQFFAARRCNRRNEAHKSCHFSRFFCFNFFAAHWFAWAASRALCIQLLCVSALYNQGGSTSIHSIIRLSWQISCVAAHQLHVGGSPYGDGVIYELQLDGVKVQGKTRVCMNGAGNGGAMDSAGDALLSLKRQ